MDPGCHVEKLLKVMAIGTDGKRESREAMLSALDDIIASLVELISIKLLYSHYIVLHITHIKWEEKYHIFWNLKDHCSSQLLSSVNFIW